MVQIEAEKKASVHVCSSTNDLGITLKNRENEIMKSKQKMMSLKNQLFYDARAHV